MGKYDLADVPRRAHAIHGAGGVGERPAGMQQGPDFPLRQFVQHLLENGAGLGRVYLPKDIDFQD